MKGLPRLFGKAPVAPDPFGAAVIYFHPARILVLPQYMVRGIDDTLAPYLNFPLEKANPVDTDLTVDAVGRRLKIALDLSREIVPGNKKDDRIRLSLTEPAYLDRYPAALSTALGLPEGMDPWEGLAMVTVMRTPAQIELRGWRCHGHGEWTPRETLPVLRLPFAVDSLKLGGAAHDLARD